MKKLFHFFIVLLFIFTILNINTAFASSPTPPLPICFIKGTIVDAEYRDAGCIGNFGQQVCHPDEYLLTIDIEEVNLVEQREYDYGSCEEAYAVGSQQTISLPKEVASKDGVFEVGLKIEGEVSKPLFAKKFDSYTIEKSKEPIEPVGNNQIEKSQEPIEPVGNNQLLFFALGIAVIIILVLLIYIIFGKKK